MSLKIIIIGGGPAGLTAGAELIEKSHQITILEKDPTYVGGISRTVRYGKFRFDIGGHRFFSKNQEITLWWKKRLPDDFIKVRRLSRIFYRGKFFDYPLKPFNALFGLGIVTSVLCVCSYFWALIFPVKPETSFSAWVSNRFGRRLFNIFFKTYTEKVWGMSCDEISSDWAAQRIKGLSLIKAIANAVWRPKKGKEAIKTLIDQFEYPRLGPGMMWEKTRDDILSAGGHILMGVEVVRINRTNDRVLSVTTRDLNGQEREWPGEQFIVSMPLRESIHAFSPPLDVDCIKAAKNLKYRDFLTVALMVNKTDLFPDNWIYVHDPSVKLGRIQNFNNWSPEMVPVQNVTCLGLEYFCFEGDSIWSRSDSELIALGKKELETLGLVNPADVIDGCVVRMPKAYPVYDADYQTNLKLIQDTLAKLPNLQVVGRNGMHKYNNQDHSMMTALLAARNIDGGSFNLWNVNTDAEYHEEHSRKS